MGPEWAVEYKSKTHCVLLEMKAVHFWLRDGDRTQDELIPRDHSQLSFCFI